MVAPAVAPSEVFGALDAAWASASLAPSAPEAPSMSARFPAKSSRILPPTSEIMPRPNWAGLPVTFRSVATAPFVELPSAVSVTVTVAAAVPAPRASLPEALMTILRSSAFFSRNSPFPLYSRETGPSLTFTVPLNVSPSTEVRVAPGMQGATRSASSTAFHTSSMGAGTVNSWSSRTGRPPSSRS